MHTAPTVIVLAQAPCGRTDLSASSAPWPWSFHNLLTHLSVAQEGGLPVALVAGSRTIDAVLASMRSNPPTIVALEDGETAGTPLSQAVRIGVQTCASSPGWILCSAQHPAPRAPTLCEIARLMALHPVVYANPPADGGMPLGISPELFSELMRVNSERELHRLINRYPSKAVEVDALGALVDRAALPGTAMPTAIGEPLTRHKPD